MVSRPEARKRDRCSRGRDEVSKERKRENGYCGLSILFLRILLLRFVHVLFLSLALSSSDPYARFLFISVTFRSPCSVLDWFENSASFSHRVLFFFSLPFFLSFFFTVRSKVTPRTKFDESKCARLARLDYYTRREAALCQALNHVRG